MTKFTLTAFFAFAFSLFLSAQSVIWKDIPDPKRETQQIFPESYRTMAIDFEALKSQLLDAPAEGRDVRNSDFILQLPTPDGGRAGFKIAEESIMASELQARYPNIRTYMGVGTGDFANARISLDFTLKGFHAQILIEGKSYYIDPLSPDDLNTYIIYTRESFFNTNTKEMRSCEPEDIGVPQPNNDAPRQRSSDPDEVTFPQVSNGTELRTYRLALACTGEYAQFHGGTKPLVLSAMTTTMNRVNGIYRSDLCLRMQLISNNDDLIFLDPATDGYSNNDGVAMLTENQTKINFLIGSSYYDIGHVFSTGGGGVASLGVVCSNIYKARGVTGLSNPSSDPFDVDYVAHEMGHQWNAEHTFNNSCSGNRNASTAYEPGSGSTIMSYTGICSPNLQSNSDAYFHNNSYNQIVDFSVNGGGNSCATITSSLNSPPLVSVPPSGFSIPKSTPFELTASATDPNNDAMTYCWEQNDLGPVTASGDNNLSNPSGNAPIFRSWAPTSSPTRIFPRISDLVNNTTVIGEHLPSYARDLTFKCTVRDSYVYGAVNDAQVTFDVAGNSGPFVVTSPNTAVTWIVGANGTVSWNVANTTASPVSCSTVDIYLSTDGGYTYPTLLLANTANDGLQTIVVPDLPTAQARIKVKASSNIFFDISNQNFTIATDGAPPENDEICTARTINCGDNSSGTSVNATPSSVGNPSCAFGSQKDVFFKFSALANVDYSVTVNGDNYDGVLAAYTGSCSGTLTQIACADNGFSIGIAETINISVSTDQEIILQTYNWNSSGQADFTITLNCPIPGNDDCADAISLSVNNQDACPANQVEGTTYGATASYPEACEEESPDVYYAFNSGSNTELIINLTAGTAEDLVLSLFESNCSSTAIYCNVGLNQSPTISVNPSTTYYVRVHSFLSPYSGSFNICVEKVTPEIATLNGSITGWNSDCATRNVKVSSFNKSTFVIYVRTVTLTTAGTFVISDVDIPTGTYDILTKVERALAVLSEDVVLNAGANSLSLGPVLLGDVNDDNVIDFVDVSIFSLAFGASSSSSSYNPIADLNCDGVIDFVDVAIFSSTFGQAGENLPSP